MLAEVAELRAALARNLALAMEVGGRRRTHVADEAGISRDLLADALRERVAVGLVQLDRFGGVLRVSSWWFLVRSAPPPFN